MKVIAACVIDGQGFEIEADEKAEIEARTAPGAVPALVCSNLCADEYDINCLDWSEAEREAKGIRAY